MVGFFNTNHLKIQSLLPQFGGMDRHRLPETNNAEKNLFIRRDGRSCAVCSSCLGKPTS